MEQSANAIEFHTNDMKTKGIQHSKSCVFHLHSNGLIQIRFQFAIESSSNIRNMKKKGEFAPAC